MTSKPSLTNCPKAFAYQGWLYSQLIKLCFTHGKVKTDNYSLDVKLYSLMLIKLKQVTVHRSIVQYVTIIQVVIVSGFHLFPFRTEKLSPSAPMVLHTRGRVGSRRFLRRKSPLEFPEDSFLIEQRAERTDYREQSTDER